MAASIKREPVSLCACEGVEIGKTGKTAPLWFVILPVSLFFFFFMYIPLPPCVGSGRAISASLFKEVVDELVANSVLFAGKCSIATWDLSLVAVVLKLC